MGMPAARMTDFHVCPMVTGVVPHVGGPIMPPCEPTVLTGKLPQARMGDMATCVGPPDTIIKGSFTVLVGKKPAARMFDNCVHGGMIMMGEFTVLIGDAGSAGSKVGGMNTVMLPPGIEGKATAVREMAEVLIEAAKEGKPFCEQCMKAAMQGE